MEKDIRVNVDKIMEEIRSHVQTDEETDEIPLFEDIPMDEYNALEVHHFQYPSALSQTGWDGEEINWKELDDALDYINKRYEVGYYWEMGRPGL